jgi:hypothetical protein
MNPQASGQIYQLNHYQALVEPVPKIKKIHSKN